MTIADVAALTKVSSRYLTAIERDEFDLMPSRVHTLGFTRAFAKAVHLDEGEIVAALQAKFRESASVEPSPFSQKAKSRSKRDRLFAAVRGASSFLPRPFNASAKRGRH
ncbi:helix-turn-helix domain-containing protein [Novosphingobium sp. 2580]|uniref:Helix-turn-helix domain-containing protein n=2 Tax=Novosphingobium album (ex Hu et al. 2023) TaxID=2930093 RepID=A0ABT0B3F2_9SPHN|nr:helix-turn-helix domain-containing protein [Novosphingobium album (ex Hu et al. 2023)]